MTLEYEMFYSQQSAIGPSFRPDKFTVFFVRSILIVCFFVPCIVVQLCNFNQQIAHFLKIKVKVKVTLVQALRLCTGCTAHRGSRGIVLLFHDQRY